MRGSWVEGSDLEADIHAQQKVLHGLGRISILLKGCCIALMHVPAALMYRESHSAYAYKYPYKCIQEMCI